MPEPTEAVEPTETVAVVGAGPAGLAAAVTAADCGLSVTLVDAGSQPGGQYWRHPDESSPAPGEDAGQHDWRTFTDLRSRLYAHVERGRIRYLRNHQVWLLERAGTVSILHLAPVYEAAPAVPTRLVETEELILCPGGYDRQLPVPGWDLPGVMAAGGVQALIKGNRSLAGKRAVVAGTGPFLLPVATGLARAGATVVAICEANSPAAWLKHLGGAMRAPAKALEGAEYAAVLARHRIPYRSRTGVVAIHGDSEVRAVTLAKLDRAGTAVASSQERIDVDLVALGWGFTPSLELVLATGADTAKDVDGSLVAVVDDELRSSVDGVRIAGEATGIGGAMLAVHEGELAALGIAVSRGTAVSSGAVARGERATAARIRSLKRAIRRARAFAVAMHRSNPVPERWYDWLTPDTLVCRCEEVSSAALCAAQDELGAEDPRSVRSFARPGMGWCQGRVCGFATTEIVSARRGRACTAAEMRPMAKRSLAAPVTLAHLAALGEDEIDHT